MLKLMVVSRVGCETVPTVSDGVGLGKIGLDWTGLDWVGIGRVGKGGRVEKLKMLERSEELGR